MPIKQSGRLFKALANERRLEIMRIIISKSKLNVIEISDQIELAFKSTSKHLQILENADLLICRRDGRSSFYSINKKNYLLDKTIFSFIQ